MRMTEKQRATYDCTRRILRMLITCRKFNRDQVTQLREELILYIIEETNHELAKRITAIKP